MKIKHLITSIVITIILFFILGYVNNKVLGVDSMVKALVVKPNITINKFERIDSSMFDLVSIPASLATNSVSNLKEVEGQYALTQMFSGDILRTEKFGPKAQTNIIDIEPNMRKLAITVSSLADSVAGQVRENSYVDILFTNNPTSKQPNIETITLLQRVKVLGVTDSNGALIQGINAGKISAVIVAVSPEDANLLVNSERKGIFRLIEVDAD